MIDEMNTPEWRDWRESVQGLQLLESFYTQWETSDKKLKDIWTSFRLLPLQPAYLIASHYHYDQCGWSLMTKWKLYVQFDKVLQSKGNFSKISSSIASALGTQRKIVALQKIFASLKDNKKTLQDKVHVYQDLKQENPTLYQDILHKIWISKGKPVDQAQAEVEIAEQPDGPYGSAVIKQMLFLYNEGHPKLKDRYFKELVIEKK